MTSVVNRATRSTSARIGALTKVGAEAVAHPRVVGEMVRGTQVAVALIGPHRTLQASCASPVPMRCPNTKATMSNLGSTMMATIAKVP